ncbi:mitochondrial hypoxia induced protein domain protein [Rhodotorula toruloides]|uniref:Mitochondrial hypoxia induced protein domain protein n=1 Tax=Rhodotorula toruloides TaxID=5286 RepID=A0A511KFS8_RHOTO|nr:mitochondrial hypoxia induced protein domain protein [Rhodotorula toruloides]
MGGLKGGALGLAAGGAGAVALHRANAQAFTRLTLPLKAFAVTQVRADLHSAPFSVGTAAFIIGADKASREFELAKYAVGSGTELERSSREQQRLEQEVGIAGGKPKRNTPVSTKEAVVEWAKDNRWTAVGLSWAASMVGAGAYIAATPLTFAQKLVQARMVAQGVTVVALLGSAALTQIPNAQGKSDEDLKREERESTMYAWKKDSPHYKHESKQE